MTQVLNILVLTGRSWQWTKIGTFHSSPTRDRRLVYRTATRTDELNPDTIKTSFRSSHESTYLFERTPQTRWARTFVVLQFTLVVATTERLATRQIALVYSSLLLADA